MYAVINIALGALFVISILNSDVTGEGFAESRLFPVMSTILFFYFLIYGILWVYERRLFPDSIRPSDYLEGKTASLAEVGDEEAPDGSDRDFPDRY